MAKVSIIVPVYNVEEYLEECLESLINQTFKDYEIIAVNDGSTDSSLQILNKYKEKLGEKIKIVSQENSGLAAARNRGVVEATGEFIMFLDSDDMFEDEMISVMYKKAIDNDVPVVICDLELFWENGNKKTFNGFSLDENKIYNKKEFFQKILEGTIQCQVVNKIYKKDIWLQNNIKFKDGKYYEDIYPAFEIVEAYGKCMFVNKSYYKYRMRDGSIVSNSSIKKVEDFLEGVDAGLGVVYSSKENIANGYIDSFKVTLGMQAVSMLSDIKYTEVHKINDENNLNITFGKVIRNKNIKKNTKLKFVLYKLGLFGCIKKIVS